MVAVYQQDIVWGDPQANRERLTRAFESAPEAELYVFPEMFTTGFATLPEAKVETSADETLAWMKRMAAEHDAAIAGSIALQVSPGVTGADGTVSGDRCVNRLYFVKPDGSVTWYDKRHLFGYGGEGERFNRGEERVVVEFRGIRYLLAVCYDVRFPVWLRNRDDYDAIILVANWPEVRQSAWDILTRARAIENQCFVIAANRVGDDPACHYAGGSAIIDAFGDIITGAEGSTEQWISASLGLAGIGLNGLKLFRRKFPVLADADDFELK